MKTSKLLLLMAFTCIPFHNLSLSMPAPAPALAPAAAVEGEAAPDPFGLSHLEIPTKFSVSIPTSTWLSGVGAFISCLGGLLVYQGVIKHSHPCTQENDSLPSESTIQGNQLLAGGVLLLFAGVITIVLSPKAN